MVDRLRFWLSYQFLMLGVFMAPDDRIRNWIVFGLKVAGEGIERELTEDESL